MTSQPGITLWANELDRLLQRAAGARQSGDMVQIVAVQQDLTRFKRDSPDYADALDEQATHAIFDLDLDQTETAVAAIRARSAEVYRLAKLIAGIASEAQAKADTLSGKFAVQALDAATSAINSFKQLRDQLSSDKPDEAAVSAEIGKAMTAVQNLRKRLERS